MAHITLHGRLTRDPELKTGTKDGNEWNICNFSLAVDNDYPRDDSSYFDCHVSGKRAVAFSKHFSKGSEVVVYGNMMQEPYTKDGKTIRPWKVTVTNFDFCGKKGDAPANNGPAPEGFSDINEDIPF